MTDKKTPSIEQALAEKALAEEYGQSENVRAAEKRLDSLGYKAAGEKRAAAAKDDDDAKSDPPQGRSARKTATTKN